MPQQPPEGHHDFQAFLDGNQYTESSIRRYEFIFGKTYVSTGGEETTARILESLGLKEGDRVLDVGCGIGGSAFYMARKYGVTVHGVDLSSNMISLAQKYQAEMEENVKDKVTFELSDITHHDFQLSSFDVIYSRDAILHIADKNLLFGKFFKWLKPGGKVVITDYCHGDKEKHSDPFKAYVQQRHYHLLSVPEYGRILHRAGFNQVVAEDRSPQFIEILEQELSRLQEQKENFLKEFTEADYQTLVEGWNAKIFRCKKGDQVWGFFKGTKPAQ